VAWLARRSPIPVAAGLSQPGLRRGRLMDEGLIQAQAMAARVACAGMTVAYLTELQDSVERACGLRGRSQWGRKAAAHAEIFGLLAEVVDDPLLSSLLAGGTAYAREVMLVVGRAADGMIVSSRRRLLAYLRAGDGDAAALEMERHLRILLYMGRLARAAVSER
jgi:DNA-binding FadR family transcriptional regulator